MEFNDRSVTPFDLNNMAALTYGGTHQVPVWDAANKVMVNQEKVITASFALS
jgi:hypothetical protein